MNSTNRTSVIKPLLKQFWELVENCAATPKSLLDWALTYARGQKEAINKLMQYGNMDISNNTCEQAVKPLVIDRKIFLFSTSMAGAKATALWLTLIESAKANQCKGQL